MNHQQAINTIRKIYNSEEGFLGLHEPRFFGNEKKYINEAIDSTFVSSIGEFVNQAEKSLGELTGTGKAVLVSNGTAGLQIALKIAGVKEGDEVITQALSFVATANAIAYNGAEPVFLDVDIDTMGLSPMAVNAFLEAKAELREDGTYNKTTGKRLAACVPMHTFGFVCKMDELLAICEKWKIPVVEDAAEALGSKYKSKPAGSLGQVGVYSFNGNKIITSGGGGAIISSENSLIDKAKHLTTTAKVPHPWDYAHDEIGYNYRMPNLNAALLYGQLEQLEEYIRIKSEMFSEYLSALGNIGYTIKSIPKDVEWNYWLISVQLNNKKEHDEFLNATNAAGVMTRPIWRLLFRLPMYAECQKDEQNNALFLEERIVNIPSSVRI